MPQYSAIFFDLDGTLRISTPERHDAFVRFAGQIGLHVTEKHARECEIQTHRYWASNRVDADLARFGGLNPGFWTHYHQLMLDAADISHHAEAAGEIQARFDAHYDPDDMLFGDAHTVLRTLKNAGYILGLVSNRDDDLGPLADKYAIRGYFDFLMWGGLAQSYKPDTQIFTKSMALAGLSDPSQVLYVGDNYFADVVGARNAGMPSILIDPRDVFADVHPHRVRRLRDILLHIPLTLEEATPP
jgi:putative hydrolase of the HAD superfamily